MFHVALLEPEIPPNTGNVARLCAATSTPLHLIGRVGFRLDSRSLRRAGLDYRPHVTIHRHATMEEFEQSLLGSRVICFSARAKILYTRFSYEAGDCLLFGGETNGLPETILQRHADRTVCIPIPSGKVRSLNLATAVGIALYEALRQRHRW